MRAGAGGRRAKGRRRPRFVFLVWALAPGGTLSVLRDWVPRLAQYGDVSIVTLGPNRASLGVPTVTLGGRRTHPFRFPNVLLYVARMTAAAIRRARPGQATILIPQDALATGAAAAIAGLVVGARVVVMEHGSATAFETEQFWRERRADGRFGRARQRVLRAALRLLNRFVLRRMAVALVAGDDAAATFRSRGVGPDRLLGYRFGVDLDRFHPATDAERAAARGRWGLGSDGPVIVSVSRLAPEKGLHDLIAAVAGLPSDPAPRLVVAGDGPIRAELERAAAATGVSVTFSGSLEGTDVASILQAADCFVYPALRGANTPFAVLEAMASGLPVVATTAPEVHADMLAAGRGIAVNPGDRDALRAGLSRYISDRSAASAAGTAARRYAVEHHAPAQVDRAITALMDRLRQG